MRSVLSAFGAWTAIVLPIVAAEPTSPRAPVGYFALQPGDPAVQKPGSNRQISTAQLQLPHIAGLTIRARWSWLHLGEGKFDFSFLDSQVERCRQLGKPYKLLVMTGANCSPEWIGGDWYRGAPVPWSPELSKYYGELVAELGRRYAEDPLLVGVHVTGPTFPSAEMHPAPGIESVKGYSDQKMLDAWAGAIDQYAAAFPSNACILSISVRRPANRYLSKTIDHGRAKLGERLTLQHNALKAGTQLLAPHHRVIAEQHQRGVRVGFEMVSAAANNPTRFGSPDVMDGVKIGKAAGGTYFDIYPPDLSHLR
jgi:hypothetical protein